MQKNKWVHDIYKGEIDIITNEFRIAIRRGHILIKNIHTGWRRFIYTDANTIRFYYDYFILGKKDTKLEKNVKKDLTILIKCIRLYTSNK